MSAPRRARTRALLVLCVAAALTAGAAPATAADVVPRDHAIGGTFYLASAEDGSDLPVGASVGWNQPVLALPRPGDLTGRLTAPPNTESVVTFVGPQGRESDPASWNASAPWGLTPPGLWLADVTPYHLVTPGRGNPSGTNATASVSGDYSLGVAYLMDGGQRVAPGGLFFVHIHLTGNADPNDATYTWQPIDPSGPAVAGTAGGSGAGAPAGMLSVTVTAGSLAIGGAPTAAWTVTVSDAGSTRTLASGSGARSSVDTTGAAATGTGDSRITLTVVGG